MLGNITVSSLVGIVVFGITLFYVFLPLSGVLVPPSAPTATQYNDTNMGAIVAGIVRLFAVAPFALLLAGSVSGGLSVAVQPDNKDLQKIVIAGLISGFMVGMISIVLGGVVLLGMIGLVSSIPLGIVAGIVSLLGGLCGVFIVYKIRQ